VFVFAAAVGAVGVPVNAGLVKLLLVKVSVPPSVAKVPVVGKVTFVAPVLVNVVAKLPDVVKSFPVEILPPNVIVLPVLSTPVPPFAPGNVPVTPVLNGNPVAFVNTPDVGVPNAGVVNVGLVKLLLVKVSIPSKVAKVPVTPGKVIVVPVPAAAGATTVAVPELDPGRSIPAEANVCFPVNVCAASVRAIVASVVGKVIVLPSVPASVKLLFAVNVLPSAIVNVDELAGAVIVTLFTLVAVATPIVGVTNVGLVSITNVLPVPVWDATDVAFPTLVIGPVKFAFVAFAVLIAPVTNSVVAS